MVIEIPVRKVYVPNEFRLIRDNFFPEKINAFTSNAKVDQEQYILILDNHLINSCVSMSQMFNGQGDFFELHRRAFSTGLKVMDARRFLPHLYKVNEAMHEKGVLYGINGNLIERERVVNYTNILNLDCCVYLNGQFKKNNKEKGFRGLDFLEIVDYVQGRYISTRSPLLPCLEESCWADITLESLNRQGFPTKRSPIGDKYEPGKTAYFAIPSESSVVRFGTDSNWAGLDCSSNPDISNSSLGVFTTAEVSLN